MMHLSDTERRLVSNAATGEELDLRTGDAPQDDPAAGAQWPDDRVVRAQVLSALCTGVNTAWPVHARGVRLRGARIDGALDLEAVTLAHPLMLRDCCFPQQVTVCEAQLPALRLAGSHLPDLDARQLHTRGDVDLGAVRVSGIVVLVEAHIGGQLSFIGATLTNPNEYALAADGLTVDGAMFCRQFSAEGEVRLVAAHVGRQLDLTDTTLTNPNGYALAADGLEVDGNMFWREGFSAEGEVRLLGAHVGGQLSFIGATLTNPNGYALYADGLEVDGAMFCREGFSAEGEVRLLSARIGGSLSFIGATLTNPNEYALAADGLEVDGNIFCSQGFSAQGQVSLPGAHISGQLSFTGATLNNPDGDALNAERIEVGRALLLRFKGKPGGRLDFTHARVGGYHDAEATWPDAGQLLVDGLTYDAIEGNSIGGKPVELKERRRWLKLTRDYRPQPYEQLIAVSRRAGHDRDARHIAIAKQVARRKRGRLRRHQRVWSLFLGVTVRHGYWPWLALVWLVGLWAVGVAVFSNADPGAAMTALGEPTPTFRPVVYTADVVVPVINLRQQEFWVPDPAGSWGWLRAGWHTAAIPLGWLFATVGVAGVTGLLKKD